MTDLSVWIQQHAPTNEQALELAVQSGFAATAAYIVAVDPPPVFGNSGLAWRFSQAGVTVENLTALEDALAPFPWWREAMLGKAGESLEGRQALDLSKDDLVKIGRPELMARLRKAGIAEAALRPMDDEYYLCHSSVLRRIAPHLTSLRAYYEYRINKKDCDNAAAWQWGKKSILDPGNLALGFAGLTFVGGAHAVLLGECVDGTFVVENDGAVYPFGPDYWTRTQVDVQLFVV